jgi:DNA-binding CsgD family transcriptional regulator
MGNHKQFDQTLGLIYESALAPERLTDALSGMIPLLEADTCHLLGLDRQTNIPSLSIAIGLNEAETTPPYFAYYGQIDPRNEIATTMAPGQVFACHNHLDAHFVSRNEFYQDYLLPQVGIHYSLGAVDLLAENEQMILLGFHRYTGRGSFESSHSKTLERLLPHLRRSLNITAQVQSNADAKAFTETALGTSNLATFALSSSLGGRGALLWANRRGEALLRDGKWLCQRNGELRAVNANQDVALKKMTSETLATGRPGNLNFGRGAEHCCVTLLAIRERNPLALPSRRADILALVTTNTGQRVASVQQLMDHFKLSPAEARFVRALAHGEGVDDYANHEGLKRSTVKSHLLSAMAKTGMTSQKDIVRLVVTLPAVRG